jgi:hypothetical protein
LFPPGSPAAIHDIFIAAECRTLILPLSSGVKEDIYPLLIRTSAALDRSAETAVFMDDYRRRGGNESQIEPWKRLVQPEIR